MCSKEGSQLWRVLRFLKSKSLECQIVLKHKGVFSFAHNINYRAHFAFKNTLVVSLQSFENNQQWMGNTLKQPMKIETFWASKGSIMGESLVLSIR